MNETFEVIRLVSKYRPVIRFNCIDYTGLGLRNVMGQKIVLMITPADVRTIKARLHSEEKLGTLVAPALKSFNLPLSLENLQKGVREIRRYQSERHRQFREKSDKELLNLLPLGKDQRRRKDL